MMNNKYILIDINNINIFFYKFIYFLKKLI